MQKRKEKKKRLLLLPVYFIHQSFTPLFSTQYLLLFQPDQRHLIGTEKEWRVG
jgi:hypothetical protein